MSLELHSSNNQTVSQTPRNRDFKCDWTNGDTVVTVESRVKRFFQTEAERRLVLFIKSRGV